MQALTSNNSTSFFVIFDHPYFSQGWFCSLDKTNVKKPKTNCFLVQQAYYTNISIQFPSLWTEGKSLVAEAISYSRPGRQEQTRGWKPQAFYFLQTPAEVERAVPRILLAV